MEKGVKQRLIEFLAYKRLSQGKFEKSCGLSIGYVNNISKGIGAGKLHSILSIYPELNSDWLLTGEGEMLRPTPPSVGDNAQIIHGNENKATYNNNNALSGLEKKMDRFLEELDIKNKQIERQAQQIDKLLDMLAVQNGGKST